jgi:aspartyl-tRNA(Asn)/glutamyl-tRNA(Gln) amidotransferase subunit A
MYLEDIFTVSINLAGVPAISVPSGVKNVNNINLPMGIQFIADNSREDKLFVISKSFLGEQ